MSNDVIINEFAEKIVSRGLSVPAIFLLESTKYISFIAGQLLIFLGPVLTFFVSDKNYNQFIELIEKKENIELLMVEIEKKNTLRNK
tara:strand:+ start:997 stop:1257 length:261 start_codon:yes stop_codon:yes gene_type:complete